ncbi:MAG TPA: xanthine dehydrogenase family protein molybdopterin-binding subunit [Candidatus Binatia bacterium]|nr:xanthine dehydrogenase family protein molybdopterin-binding subunit [Candidatus Binatia bacterium]
MNRKTVIGSAVPRVGSLEKVTGKAMYAVDLTLPNMLWGKVLRSPIAYGRIKRIDTSKAEKIPGVKAVFTGHAVTGIRIGRRIYDMPVLADGIVRFVGEKVAAVAGDSEEIAEQALEFIEVEYEEIEPLLDPLQALSPSAPLLHPEVAGYMGLPGKLETPTNAFVQLSWRKGDIEAGFRHSDLVLENTFQTQVAHQAYIEPHSCAVKANESGGAEIWACSKVPFALRAQMATAFGVEAEKFLVHPCYIGGDFGGKGDFMDVPVAYVLSLRSGRPVKMIMEYGEEFLAGNPRHASVVKVKSGVTKEGRILAHRMEFIFDSGAYGAFKPIGYLFGAHEAAGPYRMENVLIEEKIVYTNKVPCGHMRAPGDPQGVFANESQMDLLARQLRMDPVRFRRMNLMADGDDSPVGRKIPHIKAEDTLDRLIQESKFYSPKKTHVGRGLAIIQWLALGGESYVFIRIDDKGNITVSTAMLDQGAGAGTVLQQIVAEELQVSWRTISLETLDTTKVPTDAGVGASRSTRTYGNACYEAAVKAREEILNSVAVCFGEERQGLILFKGGVLTKKERKIPYSEVVKAKGLPIVVQGHYKNEEIGPQASICAQMAEVEVDPETGQIYLNKFLSAHSTGKVLNPLMHDGQIDGGIVMGLGYALMEEVFFADGRVASANFGDYKIPTIRDIPKLRKIVSETPVGRGPYSSMSIGETPIITVAPAIANAIHDAVGVRIKSLPLTAEKVLRGLSEREGH